eukprot:3936093-Pleurochrysis_carterae.AAC.1
MALSVGSRQRILPVGGAMQALHRGADAQLAVSLVELVLQFVLKPHRQRHQEAVEPDAPEVIPTVHLQDEQLGLLCSPTGEGLPGAERARLFLDLLYQHCLYQKLLHLQRNATVV